jgi:hypothetical protein
MVSAKQSDLRRALCSSSHTLTIWTGRCIGTRVPVISVISIVVFSLCCIKLKNTSMRPASVFSSARTSSPEWAYYWVHGSSIVGHFSWFKRDSIADMVQRKCCIYNKYKNLRRSAPIPTFFELHAIPIDSHYLNSLRHPQVEPLNSWMMVLDSTGTGTL